VIDSARRWRWSEATSSLSAVLRGSSGEYGGVQSVPPGAFTPGWLEVAVARHALLDGRRFPMPATPASPPESPGGAPCGAPDVRSLEGPLAILLRTAEGGFFGGVVSLDPPADAGIVALTTQYGVSLAVGPAGGVALVSDCDAPPPGRVAERVYASDNWALATAESSPPGSCRMGHALLTSDRAWATTGSPLAWAAAGARAETATAEPSPSSADAGSNR
jgi:hypothetical protein